MKPDKALLAKPFPKELVKTRPAGNGRELPYVPGGPVTRRVLDATDGEFTWTVHEVTLHGDFWLVRGSLEVTALGRRDGVGTAVARDEDSPKAAETDAFKRAAMRFGVALELYEDCKPAEEPATVKRAAPKRLQVSTNGHKNGMNGTGACEHCHAPYDKPHATACPLRKAVTV